MREQVHAIIVAVALCKLAAVGINATVDQKPAKPLTAEKGINHSANLQLSFTADANTFTR